MDRPVHGGNLAWAAGLAGCSSDELLDFSASISPLGPPFSIQTAVQAAFSSVGVYPDPSYRKLREAIATHHKIPYDYILPGNGAAELLNWAARDLARLPQCFCLSPGFSDYARALKAFGGTLSPIALFDEQSRYQDDWEKRIVTHDSDWLSQCGILLNNPHNPTGALFTRERVRRLLSQFALVVVDEAFMDFLPFEQAQSVIDCVSASENNGANLVVVRSLTKFYSIPGIRLGYAIAQPATLQRWQQWRDAWPVNTLAVAAGIAALQDNAFQQQTWQWLKVENSFLYEGLSALPNLSVLPGCANFFLVRCDVSATELQIELLKRHKVYIRDCLSFTQLGDEFFRVAVKSRADNQRLLDALADVLPSVAEVERVS